MDSGYYAACAGLASQTQALELVAHNLANLSTTGYRGEQSTFRSLLAGKSAPTGSAVSVAVSRAVNDFGLLGGSRIDPTEGSLGSTGNPLDVAIGGSGFFAVQSGQEVRFTRDGRFHVSATGQLMTGQGDIVLGEQGGLTLPNGSVAIGSDGTVSVDGAVVGRLRLVEFSPSTNLTAEGNSVYSAPPGSELAAAQSSVRQGMLESSNVSATGSVVQLITVQRNAEMLARALSAIDGQLNQVAVQDLPKV